MLLYYITDRRGFPGNDAEQRAALLRCVAEAARSGVDYIQLREKDLSHADLELLAHEVVHVVRENSKTARLLINTHVDVALIVGADGVHLPANAPPVQTIRELWLRQNETQPIIAVSARRCNDVQKAELAGANFVVLAPIFEKVSIHTEGMGLEALHESCGVTGIPVLALGGVNLSNARDCLAAGAAGISGIRLFQQGDVSSTVAALRKLPPRP